jgi:diacylglycerol kinase family enzyme
MRALIHLRPQRRDRSLVTVPAGSGVGVIINPRARSLATDPKRVIYLSRIVGDYGVVACTSSEEELYRAAEDFRRQGVRVVAVAGGDGSCSAALTAVRAIYGEEELPSLALLRGGTMNTLATSLGMEHGGPERRLADLTRHIALGRDLACVQRVSIDVNGRLGFLAGAGAIYGYLSEYYSRGGERPTPTTAFETIAVCCASTMVGGQTIQRINNPIEARIIADGRVWPIRRYLAIAMGTIEQIGLGFRPFHRADERLDAFHLLGIHCTPFQFVRSLPRIQLGRPMSSRWVQESLARRVTIESRTGVVPYMIDGDLYLSHGPLTARVGPKVRLVLDRPEPPTWRRLTDRVDISDIPRLVAPSDGFDMEGPEPPRLNDAGPRILDRFNGLRNRFGGMGGR